MLKDAFCYLAHEASKCRVHFFVVFTLAENFHHISESFTRILLVKAKELVCNLLICCTESLAGHKRILEASLIVRFEYIWFLCYEFEHSLDLVFVGQA